MSGVVVDYTAFLDQVGGTHPDHYCHISGGYPSVINPSFIELKHAAHYEKKCGHIKMIRETSSHYGRVVEAKLLLAGIHANRLRAVRWWCRLNTSG